MSDIVERLRLLAATYPLWGEVKTRSNQAADEIERLRAAGDALAATWPEGDLCNCNDADCRAVVAAVAAWKEARRG